MSFAMILAITLVGLTDLLILSIRVNGGIGDYYA